MWISIHIVHILPFFFFFFFLFIYLLILNLISYGNNYLKLQESVQ